MQKQILFIGIIFITSSSAMEQLKKLTPRIMYNKNSASNALIEQLSKKFNSLCIRATDETLDNACTTIHATQCIITPTNPQCNPNYMISLAEGRSFIGLDKNNDMNIYAPIPTAAAYALETNLVKRILIIDENITPNTVDYYCSHGNGSIFVPTNSPYLTDLFRNKIITRNQTSKALWNFLSNQNNNIDLAFYNINIDDVEPTENIDPAEAKERQSKILSLLYHFIPTVFIFSGDKEKYQASLFSHINYIDEQAQKIVSFKTASPSRSSDSSGNSENIENLSDEQ